MTPAELRELLELAAKAVGGKLCEGTSQKRTGPTWDTWEWCGPIGISLSDGSVSFPHTNDGDSRRLEVALGIKVTPYPIHTFPKHSVIASQRQVAPADDDDNTWIGPEVIELYGDDPCAATRLAVLRAAAAIGRAMP